MSEYKLSPWHDGSVKPVHKGIYATTGIKYPPIDYEGTYQYWDGKRWSAVSLTIDQAYSNRKFDSLFQSPKWRGIIKD